MAEKNKQDSMQYDFVDIRRYTFMAAAHEYFSLYFYTFVKQKLCLFWTSLRPIHMSHCASTETRRYTYFDGKIPVHMTPTCARVIYNIHVHIFNVEATVKMIIFRPYLI